MSPSTELINPGSILEMTQADLEALILTIRERRNRVTRHRTVAHHRARNSGVLSLRPKLEKLALRLDKAIVKLDTQLARCEELVNQVVAMRLELGDATPSELAEELNAARDIPLENGEAETQAPPRPHPDIESGGENAGGDESGEEGGEEEEGGVEGEDDGDEALEPQERPRGGIDESL